MFLGIIMAVDMEIGMITPPVGLNLFAASGVAGMPMLVVVKAVLPFLAVLFVLFNRDHLRALDLNCVAERGDGARDHNKIVG